MLLDSGAVVTGSDPKPNEQTFGLVRRGVKISRTQMGELINRDTDLVVRSAAVKEDNAEFQAARSLGVPTMKYAQLLGAVMAERFGIAVSGTHGKSTTTAMIAHGLIQSGIDASFVVGGTVPQLGGGSHSGTTPFFVAEACEFDRSFHHLHPSVAVITNIEADHLDCYGSLDHIIDSFRHFAMLVPQNGLILANGTDENIARALQGLKTPIQTVGPHPEMDWQITSLGLENGCHRGVLFRKGAVVAELKLSVAGEHNLFNAALAVAACSTCGLDAQRAAEAIGTFTGVDRRMSEVGRCNGAIVVDDYGHHPTEIRATLAALRGRYNPKRLLCVFQPHQYCRTRLLLEEFATAFIDADLALITDIYSVRDTEEDRRSVSAAEVVRRVVENGQNARHLAQFGQVVDYLRQEARPGDVIVTMGAGNIWEIGRDLTG
jgi:UDP-N-acetylmuramate--alanine ligase